MAATDSREGDLWLSAVALAVAAGALSYALQDNNGNLSPTALGLLTLTIACVTLVVVHPRIPALERWADQPAMLILGAAIAGEIGLSLITPAGMYLRVGPTTYLVHHLLVAAAAVLAGTQLSEKPWLGRAGMVLLLGVHFALGLWVVNASPAPSIDVYVWHRAAFQAVSQGTSPWGISIPNIYGHVAFYSPEVATPARVNIGYPYPPLSLIFTGLGNLLGDFRYANAAALTATGALLAWMRPGRLSRAAAILFLFTPRELFVLEQGWTEAHVVLVFAAVVFAAARSPRFLRWAYAALLMVKQYGVFTAPLLALLVRPWKEWRKEVLWAAGLAAAVTVPFALWDLEGFFRSVVMFQVKQPFRGEALSYMAWTAQNGAPVLPQWLTFAILPIPVALALWRAPRTPAGFAASSALLFVLFFAFAKQAFCNYYFFVLGMICTALSAIAQGSPGEKA
ncbi:MAG TPA: hypothetical protein VIG99_09075 [Myxococcaceae bacterium]